MDVHIDEAGCAHDPSHFIQILSHDHEIDDQRIARVAVVVDGKAPDQKAVNAGCRQITRGDLENSGQLSHKITLPFHPKARKRDWPGSVEIGIG